jgi:hypothetical protein
MDQRHPATPRSFASLQLRALASTLDLCFLFSQFTAMTSGIRIALHRGGANGRSAADSVEESVESMRNVECLMPEIESASRRFAVSNCH